MQAPLTDAGGESGEEMAARDFERGWTSLNFRV
jgi:hypothetical protein